MNNTIFEIIIFATRVHMVVTTMIFCIGMSFIISDKNNVNKFNSMLRLLVLAISWPFFLLLEITYLITDLIKQRRFF